MMTQKVDIKVITEDQLESGGAKTRREAVRLMREGARPLSEANLERSDAPLILIIEESSGVSVVELLAAMTQAVGNDRRRFGELVNALMPVEEIPSVAVLEQARRNASARAAFMQEFPVLTSAEVAELYGSTAQNRAALAQNWRKQGKVFAVPLANGHRFPLFQFTETGEPKPAIAQVVAPLQRAGFEGWQIALWFSGALASLGNKRPVDLVDTQPELVIEAAEHSADVPQ